jgi:hypothetical protein
MPFRSKIKKLDKWSRERENTAMAEQEPFIVLPEAEEIMRRLKTVNDDAYMASTFYPLIAQAAGHELIAEGVVMMLTFKIHDYVSAGYPPLIGNLLHAVVPRYIDALVDNKEIAEKAKRFHQEAIDEVKK